jgi:hypothetical protein
MGWMVHSGRLVGSRGPHVMAVHGCGCKGCGAESTLSAITGADYGHLRRQRSTQLNVALGTPTRQQLHSQPQLTLCLLPYRQRTPPPPHPQPHPTHTHPFAYTSHPSPAGGAHNLTPSRPLAHTPHLCRRRPSSSSTTTSGPSTKPPADTRDDVALARYLLQPHVRRHACKLAYAQEWASSLAQSHPPGPAVDSALGQHWQEVGVIDRALGKYLRALAPEAAGGAAAGEIRAGGGQVDGGQQVLGQEVVCRLRDVAGGRPVPVQWFL